MVDTLIEWLRSPPVPHVSITPSRLDSVTRSLASCIAVTSPAISSTVSPLMRSATMNAAIWADVALPLRMSVMAAAAWSVVRSWPDVSGPRTSTHWNVTACPAPSPTDRGSGGSAALPHDASTLFFGTSAPHPVPLPGPESMLETRLAYRAAQAHGLCDFGFFVGRGIEDLGIETTAGALLAPRQIHQGGLTPSVHRGTDGRAAEETPRHEGTSVETVLSGSPELLLVSGLLGNPPSRLHQELLHEIRGIPTVPAGSPHRRQAALARPVRHGTLGYLEQQGNFARPQQPSREYFGRRIGAEQLRDEVLSLTLLRSCVHRGPVPPTAVSCAVY